MRTLLFCLAIAIAAPVCATEYPAIGQLQTRDHLVVVHSGPDGLLYSIKTHEGTLLEHQRTEQWIAAEFPAIHETLVKGIAKLKTADRPGVNLAGLWKNIHYAWCLVRLCS